MGVIIDNYGRTIGYTDEQYCAPQLQLGCTQADLKEINSVLPIIIATSPFVLVLMWAVLGLMFDTPAQGSDQNNFASFFEGKCFETVAGAKGVAERAHGDSMLTLAFQSGVKSDYSLTVLTEIQCSSFIGNGTDTL
jgi:hypothetical protein